MDVYTKQPRVVDVALPFLINRRTVIQAGGHVGVWPQRLSKVFDYVVSFEPQLFSWQVCSEACRQRQNTLVINGALGSTIGVSKVSGEPLSGSACMSTTHGQDTAVYTVDALPVFIRHSVDAMFLDVQGCELDVLKGALETIEKQKPLLVLEDEQRWSQNDLFSLLPTGYSIVGRHAMDIILKHQ